MHEELHVHKNTAILLFSKNVLLFAGFHCILSPSYQQIELSCLVSCLESSIYDRKNALPFPFQPLSFWQLLSLNEFLKELGLIEHISVSFLNCCTKREVYYVSRWQRLFERTGRFQNAPFSSLCIFISVFEKLQRSNVNARPKQLRLPRIHMKMEQ